MKSVFLKTLQDSGYLEACVEGKKIKFSRTIEVTKIQKLSTPKHQEKHKESTEEMKKCFKKFYKIRVI